MPEGRPPPALARHRAEPFRPLPLSPAGGAAIAGVDLSRPLSPALKDRIVAALLVHHVLLFPEQSLSRERQFALAAAFGEVETPDGRRRPGKRDGVAHVLSNLGADGNPAVKLSPAANYHWHTDKPYLHAPPALTLLHAVEVPPVGGGTEFANTALAYAALPAAAQARIAAMRVRFRPAFDPGRPAEDHPLVRTHPETGRKALYLGNHAAGIVGLDEAEGRALLDRLLRHATRRRFVYAHCWRAGDLAIWDNRCLLHRSVLDEGLLRHRRILHRSVVRGTVPV